MALIPRQESSQCFCRGRIESVLHFSRVTVAALFWWVGPEIVVVWTRVVPGRVILRVTGVA